MGTIVESGKPMTVMSQDDLVGELRKVIRRGLPANRKVAENRLMHLRSIVARATHPDDIYGRLDSFNQTMIKILGDLGDDGLGPAARILFGTAPGVAGTTLTTGRQHCASLLDYDFDHFRKRVENRILLRSASHTSLSSGTHNVSLHLDLLDVPKTFLVPPVSDPAYLTTLHRIIALEQIDFVHPQPDVEVAFLSANRDHLNAAVFLPNQDAIELCHDKMAFTTAMKKASVAVPQAFHVTDKQTLEDALRILLSTQHRSWLRAIRGAGSRASIPVYCLFEPQGWIEYWHNFKGLDYVDFMVSELLPGREYAWQSLWHEGELITCQARERVEYIFGSLTPSGQTSSPSVARTVSNDAVNSTGKAAVRAADPRPQSVYCVNMKEDLKQVPMVTEINVGRFFTNQQLFRSRWLKYAGYMNALQS